MSIRPLLVIACLAMGNRTPAPDPLAGAPPRMLWAWQRAEDLRFLNPAHTGAAYLAATVWLEGGRVRVEPRRQPLYVAPGTYVMAVVRIQTVAPALTAEQADETAAAIMA